MPRKKKVTSNENNFQNSFSDVLGFGTPYPSVQLAQVDTLFKNLRYYLLSNFRQVLSQMYVEFGIVRTIVDLPVDDAFRGGVTFTTQELSEEELLDLHTTVDRQNDLMIVAQAHKYNRLFGGAGVLVLTEQDPTTPLDLKKLYKADRLDFHAVDLWELYYDHVNLDIEIIKPVPRDLSNYSYYGIKVDKSRVMPLVGLVAPSFIRPRLRGWGFSVLEPIVRPLNQYLKTGDLIFEVLDEFKLDIYKINNLASTLERADGEALVRKRIQLANLQKNYQNAITMDALDDYVQKEHSFTGISETIAQNRMQIACETGIPQAKLFGEASQGFGSGQDSIENYNCMVETVREKAKFEVLRAGELRCMQLFGYIPDDLSVEFKPLRILGAEQEENVKTQKFSRILQSKQSGELTTEEFRDAINRDKLLPIQLEMDQSLMDALEQDQEASQDGEQEQEKKVKKAPETKLKTPQVKA